MNKNNTTVSVEKFNKMVDELDCDVAVMLYLSKKNNSVGVVANTLKNKNDNYIAWHAYFSSKMEDVIAEIARDTGANYTMDF